MTMSTSARVTEGREEMSTLSRGWRFTIPASLREVQGWEEGTRLDAFALGRTLLLSDGRSTLASGTVAQCRVAEGGKVTVPRSLRETLRWEIGKRLVLTLTEDGLKVIPCCAIKRCSSCGGTDEVTEVIPNIYLCRSCWARYCESVRLARSARQEQSRCIHG